MSVSAAPGPRGRSLYVLLALALGAGGVILSVRLFEPARGGPIFSLPPPPPEASAEQVHQFCGARSCLPSAQHPAAGGVAERGEAGVRFVREKPADEGRLPPPGGRGLVLRTPCAGSPAATSPQHGGSTGRAFPAATLCAAGDKEKSPGVSHVQVMRLRQLAPTGRPGLRRSAAAGSLLLNPHEPASPWQVLAEGLCCAHARGGGPRRRRHPRHSGGQPRELLRRRTNGTAASSGSGRRAGSSARDPAGRRRPGRRRAGGRLQRRRQARSGGRGLRPAQRRRDPLPGKPDAGLVAAGASSAHVVDERHGAIHVPVCDLNGDGRPDFVALISQEHETVVAFLNEGGGRFRKETLYTAPHPELRQQRDPAGGSGRRRRPGRAVHQRRHARHAVPSSPTTASNGWRIAAAFPFEHHRWRPCTRVNRGGRRPRRRWPPGRRGGQFSRRRIPAAGGLEVAGGDTADADGEGTVQRATPWKRRPAIT